MRELSVPEGVTWELLVIDNGSTDNTADVVARHQQLLPIRRLVESTPGKSHALNRAAQAATGDYLLFTDDDVLVDVDWLSAYVRAFRRHPEAAVFGGPIVPWFEGDPPDWLVRTFHQVEYAFAALDLGTEPIPLVSPAVPFGANMAMRAAEQRRYPYDPGLGPQPGGTIRGEETTLIKQMLAEGASGWWVPEARVRHYVPRARQTLAYIREWYRGWGEFVAYFHPRPPGRVFVLGVPSWLWLEALGAELGFRVRRHTAAPERWIEDLKRASTAWGRLRSVRAPNGRRAPTR
jgi:glycosyltransferase involved in cell wall biosynthesis